MSTPTCTTCTTCGKPAPTHAVLVPWTRSPAPAAGPVEQGSDWEPQCQRCAEGLHKGEGWPLRVWTGGAA